MYDIVLTRYHEILPVTSAYLRTDIAIPAANFLNLASVYLLTQKEWKNGSAYGTYRTFDRGKWTEQSAKDLQ